MHPEAERNAYRLWETRGDPREAMRAVHRETLLEYSKSGVVEGAQIVSAQDDACCPACTEANGQIFSIADALENQPLPVERCTHRADENELGIGWCRCCYASVMSYTP